MDLMVLQVETMRMIVLGLGLNNWTERTLNVTISGKTTVVKASLLVTTRQHFGFLHLPSL